MEPYAVALLVLLACAIAAVVFTVVVVATVDRSAGPAAGSSGVAERDGVEARDGGRAGGEG